MPAEDKDRPVGRAAALGFHSYADDTLRNVPETWAETDDDADLRHWRRAEPSGRRSAVVIAAGLALIAGFAVAFAWSLTPGSRPAPEARPPATVAAPSAPRLRAEAAPPQAAPSALAFTLPAAPPFLAWNPAGSRPAPSAAPATAPPVQVPDAPRPADPIGERLAALAQTLVAPAPTARPQPAPTPQPAPVQASEPAPPPAQARVQPAFDCSAARSAAQQMVCGDPELAAADQRMNRAYRAALAAGAPEDQLRSEQQDWLGIREDAARHSRNAVASIYEQRIDELRRWRTEAADREPEP